MLASLQSKSYYLLLQSVLSGLLLWLGWKIGGFILFVAFIPLLEIDIQLPPKKYRNTKFRFFIYVYFALLIWNLFTTWWILNSTIIGAILAILLNSLFMTIPFLLFRSTKNNLNEAYGYFSLVLYWISFEYLHLNWDLSWSWLNLGNAFATLPGWIQWYEITGVLGGTLWVWMMNIFIYLAIKSHFPINRRIFTTYALLTFAFLWGISQILYYQYTEQGKEVEITIVQPNIDPYTEKFPKGKNYITPKKQLEKILALSKNALTNHTKLLLLPEVALVTSQKVFSEKALRKSLKTYDNVFQLNEFAKKYPSLSVLTGMNTYIQYPIENEHSATARFKDGIGYYDVFNTAMFLSEKQNIDFYHKSKLVPGVETIPFPFLFSKLMLNFGGATGSLGRQKERSVFINQDSVGFAPMICYESTYGEYASGYIQKGGDILCIMTNDAWWGNTAGHIQHFNYARLRAIELRKSIARAANTGISGFINQHGEVIKKTTYQQDAAITMTLKANNDITTYAKYGDWIGRVVLFVAIALFLTSLVKKKTRKNTISLKELKKEENK